ASSLRGAARRSQDGDEPTWPRRVRPEHRLQAPRPGHSGVDAEEQAVSERQQTPSTPSRRAAQLARPRPATARSLLDVLVICRGVNGACAAFDAATRGLSVGLVETHDWASGTSSRSSKLMHGGLRYLQMLDFKLVAEALRERDLLLEHTAPHLVKPIKFVFPFFKK